MRNRDRVLFEGTAAEKRSWTENALEVSRALAQAYREFQALPTPNTKLRMRAYGIRKQELMARPIIRLLVLDPEIDDGTLRQVQALGVRIQEEFGEFPPIRKIVAEHLVKLGTFPELIILPEWFK